MTATGVLAMLRDIRHNRMSGALLSKAETARGRGLDDDSEGVYTLRGRVGVEFKALVCGRGTRILADADCRCRSTKGSRCADVPGGQLKT
jgi:hypothetical protein